LNSGFICEKTLLEVAKVKSSLKVHYLVEQQIKTCSQSQNGLDPSIFMYCNCLVKVQDPRLQMKLLEAYLKILAAENATTGGSTKCRLRCAEYICTPHFLDA
ncbi:hypothetical protein ILYODFUR_032429, partial [Ilyodon furcidens]